MLQNPLFPDNNDGPQVDARQDKHAAVSKRHQKRIEPVSSPAVDLIREKLNRLYADEPDTQTEIAEAQAEPAPERSKHQQFMYELSTSGKSLAQIQTEWHNYYVNLPDHEKHEVWQEFYASNAQNPHFNHFSTPDRHDEEPEDSQPQLEHTPTSPERPSYAHNPLAQSAAMPVAVVSEYVPPKGTSSSDKRTPVDIKNQLLNKIKSGDKARLQAKHHLQSLLFGLGFGGLVLLIVLFSFFNEVIIAPFIQPSRAVGSTPIIVGTDGIAPTKNPEIIIPKINVEIPLVFDAKSNSEDDIQSALNNGVVHYPTTVLPGQKGNTAFFGHSSNNIFNPGKYKFAFVLLHKLVPGDTFYLTYGGKVYSYQVYDKRVVEPSEVSVLNNVPGQTATATLITCDPPGTTLHRLVIWGKQTSPNPTGNTTAKPVETTSGAEQSLPGNGPSLWTRMVDTITSWF